MKENLSFTSFLEWIKNPKNKMISRFVFVFLLGLLMLSLGKLTATSTINQNGTLPEQSKDFVKPEIIFDGTSYESKLEVQLSELLSQVKGVGNVSVMITLEDETLIEPAFNTIDTEKTSEEKDNEGGVRTVIEKQTNNQVVLIKKGGEEEPFILSRGSPKIKGILIVAEGAFSSKIKEQIIKSKFSPVNNL